MASVSIDQMKAHVEDIAAKHHVSLVLEPGIKNPMVKHTDGIEPTTILSVPIENELYYATVLHELGHCIEPQAYQLRGLERLFRLDKAIVLSEEQAAWDWAEKNALEWTPKMSKLRLAAYRTYTDNIYNSDVHTTVQNILAEG